MKCIFKLLNQTVLVDSDFIVFDHCSKKCIIICRDGLPDIVVCDCFESMLKNNISSAIDFSYHQAYYVDNGLEELTDVDPRFCDDV